MEINKKIDKINRRILINSKSNKYTGYSKEEDTFERCRNEDKGIYKPVGFYRKKQANPWKNNNISQTENQKEIKSLNIIYTNDIHGAIVPEQFDKELNAYTGGMAYMGTVIKELKKETEGKNLLLDAGDWALGSCESELTGGKTIIDVMNNLGYDGAEIGNHEFDWGQYPLKEMIDRADFPVMGANITKNDGTLMGGLTPYIIKEINGIKVGILGLISQDTSEKVNPENIKGINFKNSRKTVEKYLPEMKKNGAELIIVLSHEGLKDDVTLATETGGIDIIVGGHSHTSIGKAVKINNTIIVQAGSNSVKVGNLHINIDSSSKKILSFENSLITVNNNQLTPDSEIEEIIKPVIEQTGNSLSTVIGRTEVDLDRNKIVESVMGNVLTDAIRKSTGSDIAVENSGSIRKGIRKGNITAKSIRDVLPFNTYLVTMELTGKDIKDLLEISATTQDNLQVSGLTMTVDYSKPGGKRVSDIRIKNKICLTVYMLYIIEIRHTFCNNSELKEVIKLEDMKKYASELIGTLALVFIGCGSAVIAGKDVGFLGISFAFGLTVLAMVYAIGGISGCHINPAITISMLVAGKIKAKDAVVYIIVQCIGAITGAALLLLVASGKEGYSVAVNGLGQNGFSSHSPGGYSLMAGFVAEIILTFLFLYVIFGSTSKDAPAGFAGIAIGLALVLIHIVGIPITGTSVNPARSLGPAILVGGEALSQVWVFIVAPVIGGILAAITWKFFGKE